MPSLRRSCWALVALAFGLGAAVSAVAQVPSKVGPELQLNSFFKGDQLHPSVATGGDGSFTSVWEDDGATVDRGPGLYGRHVDAAGNPGAEFRVDSGVIQFGLRGRVAADRTGNFVVVWAGHGNPGGSGAVILVRRYDRLGTSLGGELQVNTSQHPVHSSPDVAMDPAGGFFVVWSATDATDRGQILARRFDPAGAPVSGEIAVTPAVELVGAARVAADPAAGFLVAWEEAPGSIPNANYAIRRFDVQGNPLAPPFPEPMTDHFFTYGGPNALPLFQEDGAFSLLWAGPSSGQLAQRFDAAGAPLGAPIPILGPSPNFPQPPAAAPGPNGTSLLVWTDFGPNDDLDVFARSFDASWQPLGDPFRVNTFVNFDQEEPAVSSSPGGNFAVAWQSGQTFFFPFFFFGSGNQDGDGFGIYGQRLATTACTDDSSLCLGEGGRFQARVAWHDPHGSLAFGSGHALPLTGDTGAFWFFSPANVELMIKVLDGRAINGRFWVFFGALTDVEFDLAVTDTATGEERSYHNPPFVVASQADTSAFPLGAPASAPAAPAARRAPSAGVTSAEPDLRCGPDPLALCLTGSRFTVTVDWTIPSGITGPGHAVPLSSESGTFWFFDPANLELAVKVLDGRAVNGHFWVLYGALSDVEYTITVTDLQTGRMRTYHNPQHTLASHADTSAFADAP